MIADRGAAPRGRHHEARRNDEAVIAAAREVFLENPAAKMADVAARAGVGQASLYRRYRTKDELLNVVCADGLNAIVNAAQTALDDDGPAWDAFAGFMARYVESGGPAQLALAGQFVPDDSLFELARHAHRLMQSVVDRAHAAGALRDDVTAADLALLAASLGRQTHIDRARDRELQHRHLTLILDGLHGPARSALPGEAPRFAEIEQQW